MPEGPTTDKPLHGRRRPTWKPIILTVLVFAALVGLYMLGMEFLVPAD